MFPPPYFSILLFQFLEVAKLDGENSDVIGFFASSSLVNFHVYTISLDFWKAYFLDESSGKVPLLIWRDSQSLNLGGRRPLLQAIFQVTISSS